jgi:hypothetical protein
VPAFMITRIQVDDYDTWRRLYDQDVPRAREKIIVQRVFRTTEDPTQVFVLLEFGTGEDAEEARDRLVTSGVLDRFDDVHGPTVVVEV